MLGRLDFRAGVLAILGLVLQAPATASEFKVVYSFTGGADGGIPQAPLVFMNNTLFGTTSVGGSTTCNGPGRGGCGTVFAFAGRLNTIHVFQGPDGIYPSATLLAKDGMLYGTASGGGTPGVRGSTGGGVVFKMTPAGVETVLLAFGDLQDGAEPEGGLVAYGAGFAGTTAIGTYNAGCPSVVSGGTDGSDGCGTVFSLDGSSSEHVLFKFGDTDGDRPNGSLLDIGGVLYGVTALGGDGPCAYAYNGCGTVFSLDPSGKETLLHQFQEGGDGARPLGPLVALNGKLYGTTAEGGINSTGTVFSVTLKGAEQTLYVFSGGGDGETPNGGLVYYQGAFYGTTTNGGGSSLCYHGCGTIFKIGLDGRETVLHAFQSSDGSYVYSGLTRVGNSFYGTTGFGGANGMGTVFRFTP